MLALVSSAASGASTRVDAAIEKLLTRPSTWPADLVLDQESLQAAYAGQGYRQLWGDRYGPSLRARQLRYVLRHADREGLNPSDYYIQQIDQRWSDINATSLAELDLLLTSAFLEYSGDVYHGRSDPFEVDPVWNIQVPPVDAISLLNSVLEANDFATALRNLSPPHAGYRWLRDALADYRDLAKQGGWPVLDTETRLEYGQQHPAVTVLRERLKAEGDLNLRPVRSADYFDQAVKYAVERFQVRHGLEMDGVVGKKTRAAMNVPVSRRIEAIRLNMERWRWLPRELGQNYILVNTAGFKLLVFERGEPVFEMSVIAGRPDRPTPVIRGNLHTVVLNPQWTVPKTILFEDFLPQQQRNPDFFASHGIRVFQNGEVRDPDSIDWSKLDRDYFPYVLRQDPGPRNPLGNIKFLFSNTFNVYMHDTPSQRAFDKSMRALSSGCIRVQEPYKLATYLLREQPEWSEPRIRDVIASGDSTQIPIKQNIPVYLLYLTAWVGNDGTISFYEDIYDLDQTNPSFCLGNTP